MKRNSAKLYICSATIAWCLAHLSLVTAHAQTVTLIPPETMALSPYGIDLRSGVYKVDVKLLSAGDPQQGGVEFRRITRTYGTPSKMAQFSHNWDIRFKNTTMGSAKYVKVTMDGVTHTFNQPTASGVSYCSLGVEYKCIVKIDSGSNYYYVMTERNGRVTESQILSSSGLGLATKVTYPDGNEYALTYDSLGPTTGAAGTARLLRVVSNRGYAMLFENAPNSGSNSFVSKACVLNLSTAPLPVNGLCPASAPAVSYGYTGSVLTSETDPVGKIWKFSSTASSPPNQFTETFTKPDETSPFLTMTYKYDYDYAQPAVVQQVFSGGPTISYGWTSANQDLNPVGLLPLSFTVDGKTTSFTIGAWRPNAFSPLRFTPGPETVTDPLNRTTAYDYCLSSCAKAYLRSITYPDGKKVNIDRDGYGRVASITNVAPAGSGLTDVTRSATYDNTNPKAIEKPLTVTDANGNVTSHTYSSDHGGILTETAPAVGDVSPQKRYEYAQRHAWIRNAAGTAYIQTSSPVWVLTRERYCRTTSPSGAGCAGGAVDEVVTDYDYGPNSGPNNLLVRGIAVTADGQTLRTCYGYDALGRKISETEPNANLATCP